MDLQSVLADNDMPVLVIRLELQLGEICFVFVFLAQPQVFFIIFFKFLKVISANTNTLCAYRYLPSNREHSSS